MARQRIAEKDATVSLPKLFFCILENRAQLILRREDPYFFQVITELLKRRVSPCAADLARRKQLGRAYGSRPVIEVSAK